MINPTLRVQQVQLPDQFINVNFMKIPKVDRCTTCHIGADRKGFEDPLDQDRVPDPSADRPHGRQRVACTRRRPSAARPATADATARPRSGRPATLRSRRRSRRPGRRSTTGSSTSSTRTRCCRSSTPRRAATAATRARSTSRTAPTLDAGMRVVETLGCWGCHRVEGLEKQHLPRVGPSLEKVAAKVTRDWATRWVMNPPSFRAEHADAELLLPRELRERLGPDGLPPRRRRR